MDFDPSFQDKFLYQSGILQENPIIRSEIPIMVPLQLTSTLVSPPQNNTTFMYQENFKHFLHHTVNGAYNHPGILMGASSSSTNPFSMIPTPPGDLYANGSIRDLVNPYYPIECTAKSLPQLGTSLSSWTSPAYGPVIVKPMLQDEISSIVVAGSNNHRGTDQSVVVVNENNEQKNKAQRKKAKIMKNIEIIKGQWTPDEDKVLINLVRHFGHKNWSLVAEFLNGRSGKQCRVRWNNHLRPNIKKGKWTEDEDTILVNVHQEVGNKWAEIARRLPGRAENTVKNHWNATKRSLKAKRLNKDNKSKGGLLQNYIMQVTVAEVGKGCGTWVWGKENDDVDRNLQPHLPTITRNSGYMPMMLNVDEMTSGSVMDDRIIDFEDAIDMDSLVMPEN